MVMPITTLMGHVIRLKGYFLGFLKPTILNPNPKPERQTLNPRPAEVKVEATPRPTASLKHQKNDVWTKPLLEL